MHKVPNHDNNTPEEFLLTTKYLVALFQIIVTYKLLSIRLLTSLQVIKPII